MGRLGTDTGGMILLFSFCVVMIQPAEYIIYCTCYVLQRVSSVFADPHRFASYLVMDPNNPASLNSALRYWGCAIQAGAQVSGALSSVSPSYCVESVESIKKTFSPLPFAYAPNLSVNVPLDWNEIIHGHLSEDLRSLLTASGSSCVTPSIKFDPTNKTVTLLMPGFDKSEIKLYQVCFTSLCILVFIAVLLSFRPK